MAFQSKEFDENDKTARKRLFLILLYPDNIEHLEVIYKIQTYYRAVGIKHDKDCYAEDKFNPDGTIKHHKGELKKAHFHFVVEFDNPRMLPGVAKEFGIDERFVKLAKSFSASSEYLLHWKKPDKYQYDCDELLGVLAPKLIKKLTEFTEETQMQMLVRYIDEYGKDDNGKYLTMRNLYDYAIKNGCFSTYRRCYSILNEFVYLKNS